MRIVCIVIGYALCLFGCCPYWGALQRVRYKPLRGERCPKLWLLNVISFCISLAVCLLWTFFLPEGKWLCLGILVGFIPVAVIDCIQPRISIRPTARMWRIILLTALLYAIVGGFTIAYPSIGSVWPVWGSLQYIVIGVASLCLYPIEEARNRRFIRRMANKLKAQNVTTVGITGSAGKTTVKRLIQAVLAPLCHTDAGNYNTPIGLALTIRSMPKGCRYFIAEMGISHPGDMKELLSVVKPDIGVLTCVLPQHTLNFDGVDMIRQEKQKLLDVSSYTVANTQAKVSKVDLSVGEGGQLFAENIQIERTCTRFDLCHQGTRHPIILPLLGRGCVQDALLAAGVLLHLGYSYRQMQVAWQQMVPEPHRMQLVRNDRGITVIDDSYNCNIAGADYALEYLSVYEGRKLVVCSGISESDPALYLNFHLGEKIAKVANVLIIVGDTNASELKRVAGDKIELLQVPSTLASQEIYKRLLREGDVLLIMADLPN